MYHLPMKDVTLRFIDLQPRSDSSEEETNSSLCNCQ